MRIMQPKIKSLIWTYFLEPSLQIIIEQVKDKLV